MNFNRSLVAYLVLGLVSVGALFAQVGDDTIAVPESTIAAVVMYPSTALNQPSTELYPKEILTAFGQKEFGVDPLQIELFVAMLDKVEVQPQPVEPRWGAVVRFLTPTVLGGNFAQLVQKEEFEGRASYLIPNFGSNSIMRVVVVDSRTFLIGEETFLSEIIARKSAGGHIGDLVNADIPRTALHVFADVSALRPMINGAIERTEVPTALREIVAIPNLVRTAHLQVELNRSFTSRLILTAEPGKAQQIADIVTKGLQQGKELVLSQLRSQLDTSNPVQQATLAYAMRIGNYLENQLTPEVHQDQLTYTSDYGISSLPIATALLLPAVQATRAAARRVDSANRLRQMMLAMHDFHDAYMKLPTDIRDAEGRRLLSWRVQILPFIEQAELYDQFHLNEPWDSPHNLSLVDQMPRDYESPDAPLEPGHTLYLAVAGEKFVFGNDEKRVTLEQMSNLDGTSRTIGLVEANRERAVIWTKPEDYAVDLASPGDGLGGIRPQGFNAAFLDGSIRLIPNPVEPDALLQMFDPRDGN